MGPRPSREQRPLGGAPTRSRDEPVAGPSGVQTLPTPAQAPNLGGAEQTERPAETWAARVAGGGRASLAQPQVPSTQGEGVGPSPEPAPVSVAVGTDDAEGICPLRERVREALARRVVWLQRTPENFASLARYARAYVNAIDPECREQTPWLAEEVNAAWDGLAGELSIGAERSLELHYSAGRHALYATGEAHSIWSPYRWLDGQWATLIDVVPGWAFRVSAALAGVGVGVYALGRLGGWLSAPLLRVRLQPGSLAWTLH